MKIYTQAFSSFDVESKKVWHEQHKKTVKMAKGCKIELRCN